jgi:[ribosomal protein S5]-alanine N-acetyltransferase
MNKADAQVFLAGKAVTLMPLGRDDASDEYLAWLNDPDVLRYRGSRVPPTTIAELERWIDGLPDRGDLVLAIRTQRERNHIGNISLNTIQWVHRSAELSIMIGAKDVWGRGYGTEAIALLTAHAFSTMGLHRLWAESPNPAFNAAMTKLAWTHEGVKREAFLLDGAYIAFECWSILEPEWRAGSGRLE